LQPGKPEENCLKICRKCSAENPDTNQYCKNCGAVLEVSTKMVMAQPKTIIPPIKRIKKRWIIYGMLIMFGSIAVATLLSSFIIFMIFNASDKNITELWYNNPGLPVFIVAIYLILFFAGGLIITVITKSVTVAEPAIAAVLAIICIGAAAGSISGDALYGVMILTIPGSVSSAAGGWAGKFFAKEDQ
jgi:hypothetical protein